MRKILFTICILCFWASTCFAGMLNDFDTVKEFAKNLNLKYGTFYDAHTGNWEQIVAASIYDFCPEDIPIVSIETGYMTDNTVMAIVNLNLVGLDILGMTTPLGEIRPKIGGGIGYDFGSHEPAYGVAVFGFTWDF